MTQCMNAFYLHVSGVTEEDYHYVGSEERGNSELRLLSKAESREPRGKQYSKPSLFLLTFS